MGFTKLLWNRKCFGNFVAWFDIFIRPKRTLMSPQSFSSLFSSTPFLSTYNLEECVHPYFLT